MDRQTARVIILTAVFACACLAARAAVEYRENRVRSLPTWDSVPYQASEWQGRDAAFDSVFGKDPSDSPLLRVYRNNAGKDVIVYVGYYSDLAGVMELHTPEICYPAQGWFVHSTGSSEKTLYQGLPFRAQEMLVSKGESSRLVMWWYNAGSRPFENRIRYLYFSLALASLQGRTDGSLVRLEAPLEGDDVASAKERLERFRADFLPYLESALPR